MSGTESSEGLITLPRLIDCHVHFREPGLEHKATMKSESDSAFFGGVGTVCEMPNTNPATVTVAALADKVRRASEIGNCDIRFFFGITQAEHLHAFRDLMTSDSEEMQRLRKRCCGVKLYLDHSTGNQKVDGGIVEEIFQACAELNVVLVAHCEDADMNEKMSKEITGSDVALHSERRPAESEAKAIEFALGLAKKHGTHLHVAHLSTKQGIELVREAKKDGLNVTCEVTPHHLFLTVEDYETLGTLAKMNPPLRSSEHRDALWEGIADGTVDCVSTDHAPHTLEEKQSGEPLNAPSGVPGVETMVPLLLSVANNHWPNPQSPIPNPKLTYSDIQRLCFENPNRIFNLGKSGDEKITIDPNVEWTIKGSELHSKCGWTPFEGWTVRGKILQK